MRHIPRCLACLVAGAAISATSAFAQPRFALSLNGGYQPSTTSFDDSFTFDANRETGTTRTTYPVEAGVLVDVGFSQRLWRGLGVGLSLSRFDVEGVVSATSSIPHPFDFDRNREVTGEADSMRRSETAVHAHAQYLVPIGNRLHLTIMAGPSFFAVDQTVVLDVNYTEEYPYDTAAFAGVDASRKKGDKFGFNAGIDVRWMFTSHIGAGALARFSRATIDLNAAEGRTVAVDAGGTHVGLGLRVVF